MPDLAHPSSLDVAHQLAACSRVTGLELCFHDYQMKSGLVLALRIHSGDRCMNHKAAPAQEGRSACYSFCGAGGKVDKKSLIHSQGWVHRCPFGLNQISVPLFSDGRLLGVLFGVVKKEHGCPDQGWLEDRRIMLLTLASHLAGVLQVQSIIPQDARKQKIQDFLQTHMEEPLELADIAKHLHLSPSRARHAIKELYGQTFAQRLAAMRLDLAAIWLTRQEDISIGEIAQRLCFYDQSHFTRTFTRRFKMPPLVYRKKTRTSY